MIRIWKLLASSLLSGIYSAIGQKQSPVIQNELPAEKACHILAAQGWPVSFPGEAVYEDEQANYWSARQSDQNPTCRVTPNSHDAVAEIMKYLHSVEADFSIVSGGHGTAEGASNLAQVVTLDLSKINSVLLSNDASEVTIGTGARWGDVYQKLDAYNITVAGARAGNVGVGGFLLGGGISHLAVSHGWGCDNVLDVDIVLSNGTRMHVNEQQFQNIFRAMKGAGSNIAIPLAFKMKTVPYNIFQDGLVRYSWEEIGTLLHEIVATLDSYEEGEGAFELSMTLNEKTLVGFLMYTQFGHVNQSVSWQRFQNVARAAAAVESTTPGELADTFDRDNPAGYRQQKGTLTIRNDAVTLAAITQLFAHVIQKHSLLQDPSYRPGMIIQPIAGAQIGQLTDNSLGLEDEHRPLLLLSFEVRWADTGLDTRYVAFLDDLLSHCQRIANARGALHPFIYLNYAATYQDPFGLLRSRGKLADLDKVAEELDVGGYLDRHLKQPFKLERRNSEISKTKTRLPRILSHLAYSRDL